MSYDSVGRISLLRNLYQAKETGATSDTVRELQQIKNELKIANDERASEQAPITNATGSPYLPDQMFYKKDVVMNSLEETKWKEVKTADQVEKEVSENFSNSNQRKLNII